MLDLSHALIFLVQVLLSLWIWTLLFRFFLQKARVNYHDPIAQLLLRLTEWLVRPTKRYLKLRPLRDFDFSILLWVFVFSCFEVWALYTLSSALVLSAAPLPIIAVLFAGLLSVIRRILDFFFYAILIRAILSWFPAACASPYFFLLCRVTSPILSVFRRFIPPIGSIDLSPLWALIALQVLRILIFSHV